MATQNKRSADFRSPIGRISYAQSLFKARAQNEQDKDNQARWKYSATLIFPKSALTEKTIAYEGSKLSLQDIVQKVIVEQWGDKAIEMAKNGMIRTPFLAGDGKSARSQKTGELHPGMGPDVFFIRVAANYLTQDGSLAKPPFVSKSRYEAIPATPEDVYSGCYGFAGLNCYTWDHPQNGKGVSFGILAFYKTDEGDRLGGEGRDPERFLDEKVEDHGAAPEATRSDAGAGALFGS